MKRPVRTYEWAALALITVAAAVLRLIYIGKVGTGWSRTVSSRIRKQLETVVSSKSKLTKPNRAPNTTWVEPKFVAEVEYRDITADGLLRASSFKGLSKA